MSDNQETPETPAPLPEETPQQRIDRLKRLVRSHRGLHAQRLQDGTANPAELEKITRIEVQIANLESLERMNALHRARYGPTDAHDAGTKAEAGRAKGSGRKPRKAKAARAGQAPRRAPRKAD